MNEYINTDGLRLQHITHQSGRHRCSPASGSSHTHTPLGAKRSPPETLATCSVRRPDITRPPAAPAWTGAGRTQTLLHTQLSAVRRERARERNTPERDPESLNPESRVPSPNPKPFTLSSSLRGTTYTSNRPTDGLPKQTAWKRGK